MKQQTTNYYGMGLSELRPVPKMYKDAWKTIRAVNHKLRQRMIEVIQAHDQITVTDVCIRLRLEQSVASQHLAVLRRAGIVLTERQGKFIYYRIDNERLAVIKRCCKELA